MEVRKPNPNRWSWEVAENDIAAFVHASPEKARSGQRAPIGMLTARVNPQYSRESCANMLVVR